MAWLLIILAILMIGIAKSGFGSGLGLLVVPLTAIALAGTDYGSEKTLGLLLPLLVLGDIVAVYLYRREFSPKAIARLLPFALVGIILGTFLLHWLRAGGGNEKLVATLIRLEIGLESIFLVGLTWWRQWQNQTERKMREPWRSGITGTFAGFSSTLAHAAGPVVAMYLLPLKLDRRVFVGTSAFCFFLINGTKIPAYWMEGIFAGVPWKAVAWLSPLVIVGSIFGRWLVKRVSDKLFTQIVLASVFALGVFLAIEATWTLFQSPRS